MCYAVKIDLTRGELETRFGAKFVESDNYKPDSKSSAFSLPLLPVICSENPAEIRLYLWGLIPFWTGDAEKARNIRMKTFNARAESLAEKASYKHVLNKRRCIIPVNGFYEWQTAGKNKIPYFIGLNNEKVFGLAGLYDQWKNPGTGEQINTFTVITTQANPLLEVIHNLKKRMPVILSGSNEKKWLDIHTDPVKEGIFEPYPEQLMFAEKLS